MPTARAKNEDDLKMKTTWKMKMTSKIKMTQKMNMASTIKKTSTRETCNIVGGIIYYLQKMLMTPPKPEMPSAVQLSKPEIEFDVMKEMYAALGMHTCSEKTTF